MLCRQGPSERYAPLGYPSHRYRGGPLFAKPWAATPLRRPFDFRSSWQLLSWSKRWANAVFGPIWRSTLTYFAIKFLVKTFDFRSFFYIAKQDSLMN